MRVDSVIHANPYQQFPTVKLRHNPLSIQATGTKRV